MLDDRDRTTRFEEVRSNDDEWRREKLSKMDRLESKVDSNRRWTIGLPVIILIAIIGSNRIG